MESAWFDPIRTAQTGRTLGHQLRRPVPLRPRRRHRLRGSGPGAGHAADPRASAAARPREVRVAGHAPAPPAAVRVRPRLCEEALRPRASPARGSTRSSPTSASTVRGEMVTPPTWRRDVEGKADLVEEVARIEGFGALPSTPLPEMPRAVGGVLTVRQTRMRNARRAMAARGYAEAVTWSFMRTDLGEAVRRRRREAAAVQSDRLGPRLHAALDPAEPDRGRRPATPARASPTRRSSRWARPSRATSRPTSGPSSPPSSRRTRRAAGTARRPIRCSR